jgi:hypothetical protein
MKAKVKVMMKEYFKPTPKLYRKIGDALLSVSTMVTGLAIYGDYKWVAITSLIIGVIGKFMSNFFSEELN